MRRPFDTAVKQHGATVLRVCRAVLGPGPDADDAWSETFLAALKAWPELAEDTDIEAWLVRAAGRKAIDGGRGRSRRAGPRAALPERRSTVGGPGAGGGRGGEAVAARAGRAGGGSRRRTPRGVPGAGGGAVWEAVAALPERQRLALAYHSFGGLKHTETAEIIGGRPDAVRRAAADGMKALRRTYGAGGETAGGAR